MNKKRWLKKVLIIWRDPKAKWIGIIVAFLYFIIYLVTRDHLFLQQATFDLLCCDFSDCPSSGPWFICGIFYQYTAVFNTP